MKKKLISLIMILVMVFSLVPQISINTVIASTVIIGPEFEAILNYSERLNYDCQEIDLVIGRYCDLYDDHEAFIDEWLLPLGQADDHSNEPDYPQYLSRKTEIDNTYDELIADVFSVLNSLASAGMETEVFRNMIQSVESEYTDGSITPADRYSIIRDTIAEISQRLANLYQLYQSVDGSNIILIDQHKIRSVPAQEPTVEAEGNIEHYFCDICYRYFSDENGEHEIFYEDIVIPKLDPVDVCVHELIFIEAKDPTVDEEGNIDYYVCSKCGKYFLDEEAESEVLYEDIIIEKLDPPVVIASGNCPVNLTWTLYDNGLLVISGTGAMIVSGEMAWRDAEYRYRVIDVIIDSGVTNIDNGAFLECNKMQSVSIPNSVTEIGLRAFSGCWELKELSIPDSVKLIDYEAFVQCKSLLNVTIGNGLISIGTEVFSGCSALETINLPSSLTSIGEKAFYGCSNLKSIDIPNGVTEIYERTFYECHNLASVTLSENLQAIDDYAFRSCKALQSIVIPNSVSYVGKEAFANCGIKTAVLSENMSVISPSSFGGCSSLTDIVIPESVVSIGDSAFSNCSNLATVTFGDALESIGANAFYACGLTSVVLPESITSLGNDTFHSCRKLEYINIPHGIDQIPDGFLSTCDKLPSIIIPENICSIGSEAFYYCNKLTEIIIPESVTSIGNSAFSRCTGLTEMFLPDSIDTISGGLFKDCSNLVKVNIPESVTSIGNSAFYLCSKLSDLYIPKSVRSIGSYAFYKCTSFNSIIIPDSVSTIGNNAFLDCTKLSSVNIPDGLENIEAGTFKGCTGLKTIIIPESVQSIGKDAFHGCTGFSIIRIPESVSFIDNGAFAGLSSCCIVVDDDNPVYDSRNISNAIIETATNKLINGCDLTTIPSSVVEIDFNAFADCTGLTDIRIPQSVAVINNFAFNGCKNLRRVYYPGLEENWTEIEIGYNNNPLINATIYYKKPEACVEHRTSKGLHEHTVFATCLAGGSYELVTYCLDCETELSRNLVNTDPGNHIPVSTCDKAPTCIFDGFSSGIICALCGETITGHVPIPATGHSMVHTPAKAATETKEGNIEYYTCSKCGKIYSDPSGVNEISIEDTIISYIIDLSDAVISLSNYYYTYDGTEKLPAVSVMLNGSMISAGVDFVVQYKNNINAGTAAVIITGIGKYSGSAEKTFTICFKDVPTTHNFSKAVYWATENGIAAGYSGAKTGYFGINDNVTRGQFVMFLWRAAGKPEPVSRVQTFSDVPVTSSFYKAIQWAVENKIAGGYTGVRAGQFGPGDNCTRGQIATFLWRYAGQPRPKNTNKQTFTDVPVKHNFFKAIQWAYENKITGGYTGARAGQFGPSDNCTRGQCVTFLYRLIGQSTSNSNR